MKDIRAGVVKEEVLRRVSLRVLAEEAGAVFRGDSSACPLHGGDNPTAFHLYDQGRKWHCFTRCPEGENDGDVFDFYMRWRGVDFPIALEELASRAGISNPNRPTPLSPVSLSPSPAWISRATSFIAYARGQLLDTHTGAAARAYLRAERSLQPDTWEVFSLGYNPTSLYDSPARWGFSGGKKIWLTRGIVIPGLANGQPAYIKIRRPLSEYLDPPSISSDPQPQNPNHQSKIKNPKFGGPRGGRCILFGVDLFIGFPVLLLTEGEWDAMLAWQEAADLCDVASLGGAHSRADGLDLAALACYPVVLSVSDDDLAGSLARQYLGSLGRVVTLHPPGHDLSEFVFTGHDLRPWIASQVAAHLAPLLERLDPQRHAGTLASWQPLLADALRAARRDS